MISVEDGFRPICRTIGSCIPQCRSILKPVLAHHSMALPAWVSAHWPIVRQRAPRPASLVLVLGISPPIRVRKARFIPARPLTRGQLITSPTLIRILLYRAVAEVGAHL